MKHSFIWLILCLIVSPCVSPILGQDCQPITDASNLARTSHTLNQTIGINAGFDIERFFGNVSGYSFNQDSILLSDVMATSPIIRFFYSQNKDYDDGVNPRVAEDLGPLDFENLININDRSTHFTENYVRILPLFEAGFEVQVAIEISHGKVFPDKWWSVEELSSEANNNSSPNMDQVIQEVTAEGKDWATAFLKVYDPKDPRGDFSPKPIVTVLELGNEPWGYDLGVEGFRAYIKGMYDAFADYYDHPTEFRIKLASAAFQGHASIGSDFYSGNILDYAGTMIGDEGNSRVDLSPLRNALTEGVGVHNYSFTDYCDIDANTLINHPERTNNGFMAYKNISEWVNNNMPDGTKKVNATEYGWNSDYEPRLYFPCADGHVNEWGGCDEIANYDELVAISLDGRKYDYNEGRLIDRVSQKIVGRTAQAAYIVRSTLMMNRWGVNKTMLYGLLDDWANPLYFSNGLIDTDRAQTADITLDELKDIEPNPSGKKESWYAVKRLKEILGDKYFIEQHGSEEDGGIYTYTYGDSENGIPTHLVTWSAININELENGAFINVVNDNNNINAIQNITSTLNLASLNLPAGTRLDLSQPSIYLNGKLNDDWQSTQALIVENDATMIRVSPIPVVIPLITNNSNSTACNNLFHTIEGHNTAVITNDIAPAKITYFDTNDPSAPPVVNTVCDGNCAQTESIELPNGSFNFTVTVEDDGDICSNILNVLIVDADPCVNTTITNNEGLVTVNSYDGELIHIQMVDVSNDDIIFDNQNLTSSIETELTPGNYNVLIDGEICQQLFITEGAVDDPDPNTLQCQGATIHYGDGQISVIMDNGENAGIKIHDLNNNWVVVANNDYQSNRLEVNLPAGNYLVKINSIGCGEIDMADMESSTPVDELTCQDATINAENDQILVTMNNGQHADIRIYDASNNFAIAASNDAESSNLEVALPAGVYLISVNNFDCQEITIEDPIISPPNNGASASCEDATITYGSGAISVTMNDGENAGIKIHDLLNGWVVVATNDYQSSSLVVDLPAGEYLVKINGNECEEILLEEEVITPPGNSFSCQDATISFGNGEIAIIMNDGENAGIKIHDLLNGWVVVASNNYETSSLVVDLPAGEYLVKINSNSCEEIILDGAASITPENSFQCHGATIDYGDGEITITMDDEEMAGIKIHDLLNGWVVVANNDYATNELTISLPDGKYLVKINSQPCEEIILGSPSTQGVIDCSESVITFNDGSINVLMDNGQQGNIQIFNEAGVALTSNSTVQRRQVIVDNLPDGNYTVIVNGVSCQQVMMTSEANQQQGLNNEISAASDPAINLFPNPAQDYIQVHLPKLEGLAGTIRVYDAYGQMMAEYQTEALHSYERLELTNARNGLYFMTIKAENNRRIGKRFVVEDGK